MDITLVANDTRGGVEPYLALAAEAVARGHVVRFIAPPQYQIDAERHGIDVFIPLHGAEQAQQIASGGRISLREMSERVVDLSRRWAVDAAPAAVGTDLVVSGIGGMAIARPLAEVSRAPLLRAHLQPLDAPSSRYPGPLAAQLSALGPAGRRASHALTAAGVRLLTRAPERAARAALALTGEPLEALPTILYGFSPVVVPVRSDSSTTRIATGYWTLPDPDEIDASVSDFVERPGPLVSIGFGSMQTGDPESLRVAVVAAARRVGARVVLLTGWGAVGDADQEDDDVLPVASVAHSWLLPRMWATVHHGGAGTTGAALAAGKPTVIVPFGADQPFWAARARRLGVSPKPIPRSRLTEDAIGLSLESALADPTMADRAAHLGQTIRGERGAQAAVHFIETIS